MPRPRKFAPITDAIIDRVLELCAAGAYRHEAARELGVCMTKLSREMSARGLSASRPYGPKAPHPTMETDR